MNEIDTGWKIQIEDLYGDEIREICAEEKCCKFWCDDVSSAEEAAETHLEMICNDDPEYYSSVENGGLDITVISPEGTKYRVRVTGWYDFHFSAQGTEASHD